MSWDLVDTPPHEHGEVYNKFQEQLLCSDKEWYEAALPWKGNHSTLPS